MKVFFDHSEAEAENIVTFYFKPEKPMRYTAGQYIELTLKHPGVDELGDTRKFTLSSSPTDKLLSITSKFTDKDGSSFKKALPRLKPGDTLTMSKPMGDFVLPKITQTPLIFVAGGIGITPFHSIFSWLIATGETRPIRLLYGVNTEEEIVFQPTFDKAASHTTIVVNNPSQEWGGERGYVTAELIKGLEHPSEDTLIYISGPEIMVQSLQKDLLRAGIKPRQLVLDAFLGYSNV